jgi:hypothetical protein
MAEHNNTMDKKRNLSSRLKSVLALLLVFGPASLLVFMATRGCDHKFKVLEDYGAVPYSNFNIYSKGDLVSQDFSAFKGNILLITTIQKTCPTDCAINMWHIDQMLFQHIRKNKRKKLKQVQIISFATDGKGNPLPINELETINQSLIDNVEGYDPKLWMIASGDSKKVFDFEFNGQKLVRQGKEFYGGESFQELILLLDKKGHLRMVLRGNQEGLVRRMREHIALLQKQYDKERKAKSIK